METTKNYILSKEAAEKKIRRMALEVTERNFNEPQLILAGIKENGVIIANKVAAYLSEVFNGEIIVIEIRIDKKQPEFATLNPKIDFSNKTVLLIDDVANSGKVMLYALQPLLAGYPKSIQTLALVERTHKNFPVALDYIGLSYSTTQDEHINVEVEDGQVLGAWM